MGKGATGARSLQRKHEPDMAVWRNLCKPLCGEYKPGSRSTCDPARAEVSGLESPVREYRTPGFCEGAVGSPAVLPHSSHFEERRVNAVRVFEVFVAKSTKRALARGES